MTKVITYGTFDLFHEGHYRLLQRAKALGDYLIVGVTTEEYDKARGKLNVVDSLVTRIENVRKSGFADEIIIEESGGQKFTDIKKYNVDIFKGLLQGCISGTYERYFQYDASTGEQSYPENRHHWNRADCFTVCCGSKAGQRCEYAGCLQSTHGKCKVVCRSMGN